MEDTIDMIDHGELIIKEICCTCLSTDRKLFQLCRLNDGVNNLYLLLSYDSDAYMDGFFKDIVTLFICWECRALMNKVTQFRLQACKAQRLLTSITEGRADVNSQKCLSNLSIHTTDNNSIIDETDIVDNFIDCGPNADVENESGEDIPLSELQNNWPADNETDSKNVTNKKVEKKEIPHFTTEVIDDDELNEVRLNMKLALVFIDSIFKCESCVEVFENEVLLQVHNSALHEEIPTRSQCDICLTYIKRSKYEDHRSSHYQRHKCAFCELKTYNINDMKTHLRHIHGIKKISGLKKKKKGIRKKCDDPKLKFRCPECNKSFDNKKKKWHHVQKFHKEGFKCSFCDRRFPFKTNLTKHEQSHKGPPPRTECAVCNKSVRVDMLKSHARIHANRQRFSCLECDKTFVSRASYEHHLKFTQAHAVKEILKHKCSTCKKGYRSLGELRDHVNYQHMGKTKHKCPICDKALATQRCITRHVRRAHSEVKQCIRDKICQQCGKAFRDAKTLREHESIHTGERPLTCEICGDTFRQSSSLYTHKKRRHLVSPPQKNITLCVE